RRIRDCRDGTCEIHTSEAAKVYSCRFMIIVCQPGTTNYEQACGGSTPATGRRTLPPDVTPAEAAARARPFDHDVAARGASRRLRGGCSIGEVDLGGLQGVKRPSSTAVLREGWVLPTSILVPRVERLPAPSHR